MSNRAILGGERHQGVDESISYWIDTLPWGGNPTSPDITVYSGVTDVTASIAPGSITISGNRLTLPNIANLVVNTTYRVEVLWTSGSAILETYFYIIAEQ